MKNIVYGINRNIIEDSDNTLSTASCTTSGITLVLRVVNDKWDVEFGRAETVRPFTNDQNLIDNFHEGSRRGRAATLNMVLTETDAAKAVAKALPEFEGRLTGNAARAPTPGISMTMLNLTLSTEVGRGEVNSYLREVSLKPALHQQIGYIHFPEVVSIDFIDSTHVDIVDSLAAIADGKYLVLYVWYNSGFGYSNQIIHIAEKIAGARPCVHPKCKHTDEL